MKTNKNTYMREFYEIRRSDALDLLREDKFASLKTNLKLAEMLETKFPAKKRMYLVKEDHLPLNKNALNVSTF